MYGTETESKPQQKGVEKSIYRKGTVGSKDEQQVGKSSNMAARLYIAVTCWQIRDIC